MATCKLRIVVGSLALAAAAVCWSGEPVQRIDGLRHGWTWEKGGVAVRLACVATPTGECYFRLLRNAAPGPVKRVAAGQEATFRFGSSAASYCVAVVAAEDAPCETQFITAGFHFRQQKR